MRLRRFQNSASSDENQFIFEEDKIMYAGAMTGCIMDSDSRNTAQIFPLNFDFKGLGNQIYLHQGRTDESGGHYDWLNRMLWGTGRYHYHHGLLAHLHSDGICPYGKLNASIINPFTGKRIALGAPYYYEDVPYFSLNLVSKALTADDGMGVQLELDNTGGIFHACAEGDSSMLKLGEKFAFTYPKGLFSLRNNTPFETMDGELDLLCHTEKSGLDDISCYAYISLDAVREYMLKDGYFTDFIDNGLGVWHFIVRRPSVHITFPAQGTLPFKVGDTLTVKANIGNADSAKLIIGQYTEAANTLITEREIVFDAYTLTDEDAGSLIIKVEVNTGGTAIGRATVSSSVLIALEKTEDEKNIEPTIIESDWLMLYTQPTVSGVGRIVKPHPDANRYDWGMAEGEDKINKWAKQDIESKGLDVIEKAGGKGELIDGEGRYWVAVGPNVMNPSHKPNDTITIPEMNYGTKIDIVVFEENSNSNYYIPAIVGDVKAHTYPDGLYQTGKQIPNGVLSVGHDDGSTIEFMGKTREGTDKYLLVNIIVYDK